MDMHVRTRAKSTCLVCKRTRDDHHIEMCMVIVTYLFLSVCVVLGGEPSKHAHTIDDPHLRLLSCILRSLLTHTQKAKDYSC